MLSIEIKSSEKVVKETHNIIGECGTVNQAVCSNKLCFLTMFRINNKNAMSNHWLNKLPIIVGGAILVIQGQYKR